MKKIIGECEMKKTIGLTAIVALACVATGCDQLKNEPKNNAAPKTVAKTYNNINRIPFNETIEKCKGDEFYIFECFANHGWIVTQEKTNNNWRDSYWEESK